MKLKKHSFPVVMPILEAHNLEVQMQKLSEKYPDLTPECTLTPTHGMALSASSQRKSKTHGSEIHLQIRETHTYITNYQRDRSNSEN